MSILRIMRALPFMLVIYLFICLSGLVSGNPLFLPMITHVQISDPVLVGAGDIANCNRAEDQATAQLLDKIEGTVFTLGDNAYPDGTLAQFNNCYESTWGRHKARTRPAPGNHDYHVAGAAGYYTYFGEAASPLDSNCTSDCQGYYSYDLGSWHIIVLNSEIARDSGSAQVQWLRADLAANQSVCTLAYWHKPRFSSGKHGNSASVKAFWQVLYEYGADVVLNGHDHTYERFAPQNPSGQADPARGIRQFVVGTGGAGLYSFGTIQANSEVRDNTTFGVLKLTLHPTSYDWKFIPVAGQSFTDSGSADCVTASSATPVPTSVPTASPDSMSASSEFREIAYTPSNEDFSNPERGFMHQKSIWPDQGVEQFSGIKRQTLADSLVWIYFRLDNYRSKLLDEDGLSIIRATFQDARKKGLKLVIRFVYNPGPGSTSDPNSANPDAPIELVLEHIRQLKPILVENADVIAVMQAGFVGHWGEWHSSKYLDSLEDRRTILDTLLKALPANRMLQVRYPRYKQLFYGGPLTPLEALSGSDISRIGHHNDCFLRDDDDTTYRSQNITNYCESSPAGEIACWKDFVSREGLYTPIGGETCQVNPPRTDCSNALHELETLHWSFINNGYNKEVLNSWIAGGCMETIRLRLGYRLVLKTARFSASAQPGTIFELDVLLSNIGFAAPYNPRPVYLVLTGANKRYEIPLPTVDPRRWEPGKDHTIAVRVVMPTNIDPGTYQLGLWMPDQYDSLHGNPAYSIRLANLDVWDEDSGLNILSSDLVVTPRDAQLPHSTYLPAILSGS